MNIETISKICDYKIVGGSEYGWDCFPNARWLDYENEYACVSAVFSMKDGTVYEVTVTSKDDYNHSPYRWVNQAFMNAYKAEAKNRNIDGDQAWDDVKWVDLEVDEDFLEKAKAIFQNKVYDKRIMVPIDIDNDLFMQLALEAHRRDITLNEYICELLENVLEGHISLEKNEETHSKYWYDTDRNK